MSFTFLEILALLAVVPLLIFSIFIIVEKRKGNSTSFFLGLLLLILGLFTLNFLLISLREEIPSLLKYYIPFGSSLYFLLGPILYTYAKLVFKTKFRFIREIFHYSPFFLSVIYFTFIYDNFSTIFYTIRYLQIFIYLILVLKLVTLSSTNLKNYFSDISSREITRFKIVLTFFFLLWFIDVFAIFNYLFLNYSIEINTFIGYISMILTLLLPYFIIYHVLKYPSNKFQEENLSNSKSFDIEDKFSTEEIANIIEKIENYFRLKKPYLDPNLTINKLSTEIKISPRYLSNIINQRIGKSFYDLINSYRVKEAEKLLAEDQNCSVLEICYKVGFNSKSAFNTAFKKYSGITPSSFKKNL